MSRVIKFRVWDKESEMFVADFVIESTGDAVVFDNEGVAETLDAEVMQFTGLQDKNGVDIYESDVVRIEYNRLGKVAVKFIDGAYNISRYELDRCVVIGNIHQTLGC